MRWCAFLGLAVLWACSSPEPEPPPPSPPSDPAIIELEAALAEQLLTAPARRTELRRSIRLPASVKLDPKRMALIDAGVDGRVVDVFLGRGASVEVGTPLAVLTSPEFTRGQVGFLAALADVELQRQAVTRAEELVEAEVISRAELERRRAQLFLATTAVKSHRGQLVLMGMAPREIDTVERSKVILEEVTIVSRSLGTVIEREVSRGQIVAVGELMYTIADLSLVRVEGEAPAHEAPFVGSADHLLVEIPSIGATAIRGEIVYVDATADPATRTLTVRTEIENPDAAIKPEMLATLVVVGPEEARLAVPAEAIVRDGNSDYVFVREDGSRYRFAPVEVEPEVNGLRAVSSGLREGDLVVVDGASRLNSERRLRAGG